MIPGGLTIPIALKASTVYKALSPDTVTAELSRHSRDQGLMRVALPADQLALDTDVVSGRTPVLTTNLAACDAGDPSTHAPLVFEFELLAPCRERARVPPFTAPDDFFTDRVPYTFDGTLESYSARYLGDIIGGCRAAVRPFCCVKSSARFCSGPCLADCSVSAMRVRAVPRSAARCRERCH